MREVTQLTDNRFLNIKIVVDEEHGCAGYQFAERLGKDSVAFICYDKETNMVLLNNEFKPPIGSYLLSAFGGSLDKASNIGQEEIVRAEVREEAGFEVTTEDIVDLGKVFVSTQMNQFCSLYLVYVDSKKQGERHPENKCESLATTLWHSIYNQNLFRELEDWKAITIIAKSERMGLL